MGETVVVLLNPRAGHEDPSLPDRITDAFVAAHRDVAIRVIPGSSLSTAARDAARRGATIVVAAGGDGTVSAAASGVLGTGAALGVLPLGTLNHFAKDLAIPLDLEGAATTIAAGRTTLVDVGELNGTPFVNNASVGMYARLIAERSALQRAGRGKWIAHGLAAMRVWWRYRRLRVSIKTDGASQRVRTPFVFVGNNEYLLSGFELGGRKMLDQGRLQVCMAAGMSRFGVARMIVSAVFGDVRGLDGFRVFPARTLTLDAGTGRLNVSVDGEAVALDNPLTFQIRPRVLRVVVP